MGFFRSLAALQRRAVSSNHPNWAPTTRWHAWWLDALLSGAVGGFWWVWFGSTGPHYEADNAVQGAMTLRPLDSHSFYFWGQDRLGTFAALLARPLVAFHMDAASATQVATLFCSAVGLFFLLGLLEGWPAKVALAAFFAFPAGPMAANLCDPEVLPAFLLFAGAELRAFLWAVERPTFWRVAATSACAGLLLWIGEFGLFLLVPQVLWMAAARPLRSLRWRPVTLAALVGALPGGLLIAFAKLHSPQVEGYGRLSPLREAFDYFFHMHKQFAELATWPSASLDYVGLFVLFAFGLALLWTNRERPRSRNLDALALVGPVPLIACAGTVSTYWYAANQQASRYLAFPILMLVVAGLLLLDALWDKRQTGWDRGRRWACATLGIALAMGFWFRNAPDNRAMASEGDHWRVKLRTLEELGCHGVVAGYWNSYPFYTLSQGKLPATPEAKDFVRNGSLAHEAVAADVVCLIPWLALGDQCPANIEQFGRKLALDRDVRLTVDHEFLHVCRMH